MAREQRVVLLNMSARESVVAALTMEAAVDLVDKRGQAVYEPLVYARVCDVTREYAVDLDVKPVEFIRTVRLLELARHLSRSKRRDPKFGLGPHVEPTDAGRADVRACHELLAEVMRNARG